MEKLPNPAVDSYRAFVHKELAAVFDEAFPAWYPQGARLDCTRIEVGEPLYDLESCRTWHKTYYAPVYANVTYVVYDQDDAGPDGPAEGTKPISTETQRIMVGEIPAILPDGAFLVGGNPVALVPTLDRSPGILREMSGDDHLVKIVPEDGFWVTLACRRNDPEVHARLNQGSARVPVSTLLRALGRSDEDMFQLAESIHGVDNYRMASSRLGTMTAVFRQRRSGKWVRTEEEMIHGRALADDVGDLAAGAELFPSDLETLAKSLKPGTSVLLPLLGNKQRISMAATCAADTTSTEKEARMAIGQMLAAKGAGTAAANTAITSALSHFSLSMAGRKHIHSRTGFRPSDTLTAATVEAALRVLVDFSSNVEGTFTDNTYSLENRRMVTVGDMLKRAIKSGLGGWNTEIENLLRQTVRNGSRPGRRKKDDDRPKALDELTVERIVNRKHITSAMRRVMERERAQLVDQTNPLAGVMNRNRVVVEAGQTKGGSAAQAARWVRTSHFRRLSAAESPDGKDIGLANYLALYARPDRDGFLRSPAYVVDNGRITKTKDWLTPHRESRCVVAYADSRVEDGYLMGDPTTVAYPTDDGFDHVEEMRVKARKYVSGRFETFIVPPGEVTHMDVDRDDSLAAAGALIPFVEHDDATRISMASGMARQAVPCIHSARPYVGTGRERQVADLAGESAFITAKGSGRVVAADSRRIAIAGDGPGTGVEYYRLDDPTVAHGLFPRFKLRVDEGQQVEKGQLLADGSGISSGGIALGRNMRVAYMVWHGYNFEDAIVISERVAADDGLTSLHMHQLTCKVSRVLIDSKHLPEETTNVNIPDVSESALTQLDENGIIRIGSVVSEHDILIGKVTPKHPKELTAEERLLKMVFDKNWGQVRDTSMRMPPGFDGAVVVDVQVVTPVQRKADDVQPEPTDREMESLAEFKDRLQERLDIERRASRRTLIELADGQRVVSAPGLTRGGELKAKWMTKLPMSRWGRIRLADKALDRRFQEVYGSLTKIYEHTKTAYASRKRGPDDIPGGSGVLRRIVITLAYKRRIQVGDKLAGRHGNKGVVSRVVPAEDMPFDPKTGEPVDILLNPLGVPSRMNVGQILETHLGWAMGEIESRVGRIRQLPEERRAKSEHALHRMAERIGWQGLDTSSPRAMSDDIANNGIIIESQAFNGIGESNIKRLLKFAGLPTNGQMRLCDGRTGQTFDRPTTVGNVYMYKLKHMVDDKMHARARGRYMVRTSQPVHGRSNRGGQRLGEMEGWALMAYGASMNLLEMTTIKSDDIRGRSEVEREIVQLAAASEMLGANVDPKDRYESEQPRLGEILPGYAGTPDAFDLLVYELRAMGFDLHEELNGQEVARLERDQTVEERFAEMMEKEMGK